MLFTGLSVGIDENRDLGICGHTLPAKVVCQLKCHRAQAVPRNSPLQSRTASISAAPAWMGNIIFDGDEWHATAAVWEDLLKERTYSLMWHISLLYHPAMILFLQHLCYSAVTKNHIMMAPIKMWLGGGGIWHIQIISGMTLYELDLLFTKVCLWWTSDYTSVLLNAWVTLKHYNRTSG